MLTKKARAALIIAATATATATGAVTAAATTPEPAAITEQAVLSGNLVDELVPDTINVANDLCALPWYWQGPINAFLGSQDGHYAACNGAGSSYDDAEGINVANNVCALPWLWQGPINALVGDQDAFYAACNG